VVLDTNIVVAALRSPTGASAELLRRARAGKLTALTSVSLAMEYQAVCLREEHVGASRLSRKEVQTFLDAVISFVEPVDIWFLWRPQLRDPSDELVLEAAVNGRAGAIVTFNQRDFEPAARLFGVEPWTPRQPLTKLRG
jgi:putative PIN family toxin of toxin-antitoxin system